MTVRDRDEVMGCGIDRPSKTATGQI